MTAPRRLSFSPIEVMESPKLLGPFFDGPSWNRWRAVIKAAFAEKLTAAERKLFFEVAERDLPRHRVKELDVIAGRGSGKSAISSLLAVAVGISFDPRGGKLRPGEKATVLCLAVDKAQAAIVFNYTRAAFEEVPALKKLIVSIGAESIELTNHVEIIISTANFRSLRGRSYLAVIGDEGCFWRDANFANPDTEVVVSVTPGLGRIADSILVMISSAHKRSGLLYQRWHDCYGRNDQDSLVVRGSTQQFNPLYSTRTIEKKLAEDLQRYGAEYLSQWRDDLASYISRDLLDAAVDPGVIVRPPQPNVHFVSGCDPSGGRNDSFTAAIAHREKDGTIILDALFEAKSPFNPSAVVSEIASLLREYGCYQITGDRFGAEWVVDAFAKVGIRYIQSERDRSSVYIDTLPLFTSGRARLLDNPKMLKQFASLERRTFSTGRERVDPGPGHDDLSNSVAIAMSLAAAVKGAMDIPDAVMRRAGVPGYGRPSGTIDFFAQNDEQRIAREKSEAWWRQQNAGPQPEPIRQGSGHSPEVTFGPDGPRSVSYSDLHDQHTKGRRSGS